MAKEHSRRVVHACTCTTCQQHPHSSSAQEHRRINRLVAVADERTRRLLVGFLAQQHGRRGIRLTPPTIARLLRQLGFSLRTNRKRLAGIRDLDRDQQFRYLTRLRRLYITLGLPVISVDTKKKEWVGNFKNPGRTWRRRHRKVLDHDFPSWALGRAIPAG